MLPDSLSEPFLAAPPLSVTACGLIQGILASKHPATTEHRQPETWHKTLGP